MAERDRRIRPPPRRLCCRLRHLGGGGAVGGAQWRRAAGQEATGWQVAGHIQMTRGPSAPPRSTEAAQVAAAAAAARSGLYMCACWPPASDVADAGHSVVCGAPRCQRRMRTPACLRVWLALPPARPTASSSSTAGTRACRSTPATCGHGTQTHSATSSTSHWRLRPPSSPCCRRARSRCRCTGVTPSPAAGGRAHAAVGILLAQF